MALGTLFTMQVFRSGKPYHAAATGYAQALLLKTRTSGVRVKGWRAKVFCCCICWSGRTCMRMCRSLKQGEEFDDDMEVELVAEPAIGSSAAHHSLGYEDDSASKVRPQSLFCVCPFHALPCVCALVHCPCALCTRGTFDGYVANCHSGTFMHGICL